MKKTIFLLVFVLFSILGFTQATVGTASIVEQDPQFDTKFATKTPSIRGLFSVTPGLLAYNNLTGVYTLGITSLDTAKWNKVGVGVNTGTGVSIVRGIPSGDSLFYSRLKSISPELEVTSEGDSQIVFKLNNLPQATPYPTQKAPVIYTASFTPAADDASCIYNGTAAAVATLPSASAFPNRVLYFINKSNFPLTVGSSQIPGKVKLKLVSNGSTWVVEDATNILAGY